MSRSGAGPEAHAQGGTPDPDWHLYQLDLDRRLINWARLDRQTYQAASFLDARVLPAARDKRSTRLVDLAPPATPPAPAFIFHISHCGSTLISRLFPEVHVLREPLTLRQLAQLWRQRDRPGAPYDSKAWRALAAAVIGLHCRPYPDQAGTLIKASSVGTRLARPLLERLPASRALGLGMAARPWLALMLAHPDRRRDLAGFAPARCRDYAAATGRELDPETLEAPRVAALSWLVGMWGLLRTVRHVPERCELLDFDDFLENPGSRLAEAGDLLDLPVAAPDALARHLGRYAKDPRRPYSAAARRAQIEVAVEACGPLLPAALNHLETLIGDFADAAILREWAAGNRKSGKTAPT